MYLRLFTSSPHRIGQIRRASFCVGACRTMLPQHETRGATLSVRRCGLDYSTVSTPCTVKNARSDASAFDFPSLFGIPRGATSSQQGQQCRLLTPPGVDCLSHGLSQPADCGQGLTTVRASAVVG